MRVVVLGASENQEGCIHAARRLGAEVVVVDPRNEVPGIRLADRWIRCDAAATREIIEALAGLEVDAVLTDQSDYTARAAAALAIDLGVRAQDLDLVTACTNKLAMRERLVEEVPDLIPVFRHLPTPRQAREYARSHPGRLVVKPILSQGSRGVSRIHSPGDLALIDAAFQESGGLGVLIEHAAVGREYSVDGYVSQGRLVPLGIAAKSHYELNPCLDERCDFLLSEYAAVEEALLDAMHRIVAALRIPFGIVHAELISDGTDVTLVEIALRGGGAGISSIIVPFLSGFDPAEALLRDLLGLPVPEPERDFRDRAAILRFLPMGTRGQPSHDLPVEGCLKVVVSESVATGGGRPASSADRPGLVIVGAESTALAREREEKVLAGLGYRPGT
ncbi:MAG: ATP-grasp domain-containing protein [Candidatus Nanopelagicales bacterium]